MYSYFFVEFNGWFTQLNPKGIDRVYISMEYLPRGCLGKYMEAGNRFSESECKDIVKQVLKGLSMMHSAGFAHRDLNPRVGTDLITVFPVDANLEASFLF